MPSAYIACASLPLKAPGSKQDLLHNVEAGNLHIKNGTSCTRRSSLDSTRSSRGERGACARARLPGGSARRARPPGGMTKETVRRGKRGACARAFQVAQHGAPVLQAALDRAQLLLDPLEEGAVVLRAVQLPPHVLAKRGAR